MKSLKVVLASIALIGLTAAAFANGHGPRRAAMMAKFDTNKDGKLDASERTAMHEHRVEKRFAKLDANKDGVISLDEMKAAKPHKRGKHGPKRVK